MCINNTYSCPTCHRERKETISCAPRYQSQSQPGTRNPSSATPTLQVPPPTCNDIISQYLLATCLSCTTAYRAAFEQTLRRSIAMSRQGSGSSNASGGEAEMEDPHAKLLAEERRNARAQWEAYGRRGRERICKKMGVTEDEILYM